MGTTYLSSIIRQFEYYKMLGEKAMVQLPHEAHLADKQLPHERDAFYLIISGEGKFQLLDQLTAFRKGDFLYVPAHAEHRFIEFSEDFITWVFFIG